MHTWALEGREKAFGADHMSTLATINNLGSLYSDQGKLAEAEEMYMRALTGREKMLGASHPSTLTAIICFRYLRMPNDRSQFAVLSSTKCMQSDKPFQSHSC